MSNHPGKFRSKEQRATKGTAFKCLRDRQIKIDKASPDSIKTLKELDIPVEKDLTEIRAKYLIKEKKRNS